MRVVIDANVFISFLINRGETIASIFRAWRRGKFVILVSGEILDEYDEVISRLLAKGLISPTRILAVMRRLRKNTEKICVTSKINSSTDPKDNRYLICVKDGQADYLITGDKKHLLLLKKIGKTKILTPAEFLSLFR